MKIYSLLKAETMCDEERETFLQKYFGGVSLEILIFMAVLTCCLIYAMLNWIVSIIFQYEAWELGKWFNWVLISTSIILTIILWSFILFAKEGQNKEKK
jgi:hypothetical protein